MRLLFEFQALLKPNTNDGSEWIRLQKIANDTSLKC
jgi:hypothetical protein